MADTAPMTDAIKFAISVFDDVLCDIADWEDKALSEAVAEARDGLRTIGPIVELNASRYEWLREQTWDGSELCVVRNPKKAVRLGNDCPSHARLDEAIDDARNAKQGGTHG
jgi:hypothetical protein